VLKEFEYAWKDARVYGNREAPECHGKGLPISVSLYDKSGFFRDKKDFFLTIS